MATIQRTIGRTLLATGFALGLTASLWIGQPNLPRAVADDCTGGESIDVYSLACVPDVAPNTGGAPSESALTACSGRDQGECLENQYYGPGTVNVPHVNTDVQQSP